MKLLDIFSKQIAVGRETRRFQFTRIENFSGIKFFITSVDENQKPCSFSVKLRDGHWKLVPGSLRWGYAIEEQLSNAIIETRPA